MTTRSTIATVPILIDDQCNQMPQRWLKSRLSELGFTAASFAQAANISSASVFAYLQNRRSPTWRTCQKIAAKLRTTPIDLFERTRK